MQKLIMLYEWNISTDEERKIQGANIGEDIQINVPMTPAVFQADGYYILAFSSYSAIPEAYCKRFAMVETDMESIAFEIDVLSHILGVKPILQIDPFANT